MKSVYAKIESLKVQEVPVMAQDAPSAVDPQRDH